MRAHFPLLCSSSVDLSLFLSVIVSFLNLF
jgi:hypothetical protein